MEKRSARLIIRQDDGDVVPIGEGLEAVFKLDATETGNAFTIVEHPVAPGVLVMPHSHEREDGSPTC